MKYASILQNRMKELGISKAQLSDMSGVPYSTVSSILKSGVEKAGTQNVLSICHALGITIDELFSEAGSGEMFKQTPDGFLEEIRSKYELDGTAMTMFEMFVKLSPESRSTIADYVSSVARQIVAQGEHQLAERPDERLKKLLDVREHEFFNEQGNSHQQ